MGSSIVKRKVMGTDHGRAYGEGQREGGFRMRERKVMGTDHGDASSGMVVTLGDVAIHSVDGVVPAGQARTRARSVGVPHPDGAAGQARTRARSA